MTKNEFPESATAANPVFFRTYSRRDGRGPETWKEVCDRVIPSLVKEGRLTDEESALIRKHMEALTCLPAGRVLWVAGTDWFEKPENFPGAFNCNSTEIVDIESFGLVMEMAMMGCGTGVVLESRCISQLPPIRNRLEVEVVGEFGDAKGNESTFLEAVSFKAISQKLRMIVGDSRQGWVRSYVSLFELATNKAVLGPIKIEVDISFVRSQGKPLKGFGGVANPNKLRDLYPKIAKILNGAVGRQLTAEECCLLIDEAALVVVAGNVRRCLPGNALVHTIDGLITIKDVQVGTLVQTPVGFKRVLNKFHQGFQNIYEVDTNSLPLRATLNHQVAVLQDAVGGYKWKRVAELEVGDRLLHTSKKLLGKKTYLPVDFTQQRPEQSRTAKNIIIPSLDVDIAWLIGYTHGNGYVGLGRNKYNKPYGFLSWSMNDSQQTLRDKLQDKIKSAVQKFGIKVQHTKIKGENTAVTRCCSVRLAEYFYRYIKQPNSILVVPDFIFQGTSEVRAAYLAGLMDSDGTLNNRPPHLLTTVYPSFLKQVGAILSSLGIAGRVSITKPSKPNWGIKYSLTVPALKEKYNILVAPYSIKGELKVGLKMNGFTIPNTLMRATYSYSSMRSMGFNASVNINSNYETYSRYLPDVIDIPVSVKTLRCCDYTETYDLEVEDAHCFYCDGYLMHNSAGMRQFDADMPLLKQNLWRQNDEGKWEIDPERDALRMANHTRVFHYKPTREECIEAVRSQYYSGEGAIQWAGEAIARSNADLISSIRAKKKFLSLYDYDNQQNRNTNLALNFLQDQTLQDLDQDEWLHRMYRLGLNPCGEISGKNLFCNLGEIHLNQIDPLDYDTQDEAFRAGAIAVSSLLLRQFTQKRYRDSRLVDPIVGVSFTGLFDFFVKRFGLSWLQWFAEGRPENWREGEGLRFKKNEQEYLSRWRAVVETTVKEYCDRHGIKTPNRCTTVQPAGCLDKDALRIFDQGLLYADEIVEPGSGETTGLNLSVRDGIKVRSAIANQPLQLIKVTLQNGRTLRMTPDHRLSVYGPAHTTKEWTEGKDLIAGMFIEHSLGEYKKSDNAQLESLPDLPVAPCIMTPELAYLLGAFYSAGRIENKSQIKIENDRKEFLFILKHIAVNLFKIHCNILEWGSVAGCTVVLYSDDCELAQWFKINGFVRDLTGCIDRVPLKIRTSSREVILNFIAGFLDTRLRFSENIHNTFNLFDLGVLDNAKANSLQQVFEAAGLVLDVHQTSLETKSSIHLCYSSSPHVFWRELFECSTQLPLAPVGYFNTHPYKVIHVEKEIIPDYSYDFAVEGANDEDSWYWQGGLKSHNTKSLLTGASSGWHPPKAQRYIRRITFAKNHPVALACLDYGYNIVPSQDDKDENGHLLDDPFDLRVTGWLVEIPTEVPWANLPGADEVNIDKFSALAQFDFYMQVQKHYTGHNTSATIELREYEIEELGDRIYQAIQSDEGYISACLMARFSSKETFPRLPFEPISKAKYQELCAAVLARRKSDDFHALLMKYETGNQLAEASPAGCDSEKCLIPENLDGIHD